MALILAVTVAVALVLASGGQRSRLPEVDPTTFSAARQRWQSTGPDSYEIEIVVSGVQSAVYRAVVQDGEVQSLHRNGRPLTQRRTMGTWTVPGMFDTMQSDLDTVARAGDAAALDLRAAFHPQYGYPMRYQRVERRRWGANPDVSWEVTEFEAGGPRQEAGDGTLETIGAKGRHEG